MAVTEIWVNQGVTYDVELDRSGTFVFIAQQSGRVLYPSYMV